MHGEPALPPDFAHLPYANPAAPKGGRLVQGFGGTFDSLNPFIVKGLPAQGIRGPFMADVLSGYVLERLMARGYDEPFTLYGLLAKTVETNAERSYVTFNLDPAAKFSDGKPVTSADVMFSWQLLRAKDGRTTGSITPRSSKPRRSASARSASTSRVPTTASFPSSSG